MALYQPIIARARKNPLGPALLNHLAENFFSVHDAFRYGHNPDGTHNSLDIPRGVALVQYSAGYSLQGNSSTISSVSSSGTGVVTLTLAADKFSTPMAVAAYPCANDQEAKPALIACEVVSATSVKFYLQSLSSALGAGNAWALTDYTFSVAIHSAPYAFTGTPFSVPTAAARGEFLGAEAARYNRLVTNDGALRKAFTLEHTAAGEHSVREVAKAWAHVKWNGTALSLVANSTNVTSVTRASQGDATVNFDTLTEPFQVFVEYDFNRNTSPAGNFDTIYAGGAPDGNHNPTSVRVMTYAYDFSAKTWSRADTDFFISIYGA